jgi:hypothetical protein
MCHALLPVNSLDVVAQRVVVIRNSVGQLSMKYLILDARYEKVRH